MEVNTSIAESPQGKHYTYTLAYPDGTVFYVGKGTGRRIAGHEKEARRVPHVNSHKCNTIRKIWASGEQVVRTKEAYFATHEDALMHEVALIFFMRPYGNLTNLTNGGDGVMGIRHTEATRQKLSLAHTGKVNSEVARQKLSLAHTGKVLSEEHKKKLSIANKGRCHTEAARQKIGEESRNRVRKPHTEAAKQKMRIAAKGRVFSDATRQKMSDVAKRRSSKSTVARQDVRELVQLSFEEVAS